MSKRTKCTRRGLTLGLVALALAPGGVRGADSMIVDRDGVMRWAGTREEVHLFGVNYTAPFSSAYQDHKRLGLSAKQAIDLDVAQMARLRLDAFRVHVWDVEISDAKGNILPNEHLDLLDYLLAKLAEHGIRSILTPLVWYDSPDQVVTKGFSQYYRKPEAITDRGARTTERNYLTQFVRHVNPYRKIAYKDDPFIIGLEIFNEPRHPEDPATTTGFIDEMAQALRSAGYSRPLFYNIAENWSTAEQARAVARAQIDGLSFQWYPTDLLHGRMLTGDYLPNVSHYPIPWADTAGLPPKAKMVYEFDAADVGAAYMYPAIARSFREAGMQFATMFTYDPTQLAWGNIEFRTHYLNLLYTPSKAISLLIAGQAFRRLPRLVGYGDYPENDRFGDFRVSYEEALSEMNTAKEFIYSRSTATPPKDTASLEHVAGCGSSPVVQYEGTGAYFLDRLEPGIWRLELYPDVLWLRDPFGAVDIRRQVARLFWQERGLTIAIPDLKPDYTVQPLAGTPAPSGTAADGHVSLKPGTYLLTAHGAPADRIRTYRAAKETFLPGLYTPAPAGSGVYAVNQTRPYASAAGGVEFRFQVAAEKPVRNVRLYIQRVGDENFANHPLKFAGGFDQITTLEPGALAPGRYVYCIAADTDEGPVVFPEGNVGVPEGRLFWNGSPVDHFWTVDVVGPDENVVLLDAARDRGEFVFPHQTEEATHQVAYQHGPTSNDLPLSFAVTFKPHAQTPVGLQSNVASWVGPLRKQLETATAVNVRARAARGASCTVHVLFCFDGGRNYGVKVELTSNWRDIRVPLSSFEPADALLLPNAWPMFMPRERKASPARQTFDLAALQAIQVVVAPPDAAASDQTSEVGFELLSITAQR